MQKYCLFLLLWLTAIQESVSQQYIVKLNMDSLHKILLVSKDTVRLNILNLLTRRMLIENPVQDNYDSAAKLVQQALLLSQNLQDPKGRGNALLNQAMVHANRQQDMRLALSILYTGLSLLKEAKDDLSVANCFEVMGSCYHFLGENNNAIRFFDSAIYVYGQNGDNITPAWLTVAKGHSYYDLGRFSAAYQLFQEALPLAPATDTVLQCYNYIEIATLFVGANLPEIALEYINKIKAFHINLATDVKKNAAWYLGWGLRIAGEAYLQLNQTDSAQAIATLLNLPFEQQDSDDNLFYGHLYLATKQYRKALLYFNHGFELSQHSSHKIHLARQANELGTTYFKLQQYSRAIYYAKQAASTAVAISALLEQKKAIGTLSHIYAATHQYAKSYHYNHLYKVLSDSVASEEYKRKLSLIQVRDQLEMRKKEGLLLINENKISQQQIKLQQADLRTRSMWLSIFIMALLVLSLLSILFIRNVRLNKKKIQLQLEIDQISAEQKLMVLETEKSDLEMKALRAQMNPHFIFNCLSSINLFILTNKTEEASDYLTKFSRLIRMSLQHSEKSTISLESELEALCLYLDLEKLRFKNAFTYEVCFTNTIDTAAIFIPPLLIQPFAENAIWHGLMGKKGIGALHIQFDSTDSMLTCTLIDNGIGRGKAAELNAAATKQYPSMAMDITSGRLALLNKPKGVDTLFTIEDLVDAHGNACGTKVVVTIVYKTIIDRL